MATQIRFIEKSNFLGKNSYDFETSTVKNVKLCYNIVHIPEGICNS